MAGAAQCGEHHDEQHSGNELDFWALSRHADVEICHRDVQRFSSAHGTVLELMQPEPLPTGQMIFMDPPDHTALRALVSRAFTPRRLENVLESVEHICTEVIDGFCEKGEVDLVEAMSAPFPLLVICDMMGIPRSEFKTVFDATNVILGGGDPEFVGEDILGALFGAGMTLTGLLHEVAEDRRKNPKDDLTTALINADLGEDVMTPEELGPFFILLAVAGNDTTRTAISHGMNLLSQNPDQRRIWQDDLEGVTPTAEDIQSNLEQIEDREGSFVPASTAVRATVSIDTPAL